MHDKLFPQHGLKFFYPSVGEIEKHVKRDVVKTYMGKAGTVLFVDTAGLHKGGYATGKERIMSTAGFISNASGRKELFHFDETEKDQLSPSARFALKRSGQHIVRRALYFYKSFTRSNGKSDKEM